MDYKDHFDSFLEEKKIDTHRLIREIIDQDQSRVMYFKDIESRFLYVNDAFLKKFNIKNRVDIIGKTDADLFTYYPEHAAQAYQEEQEIIRTGKALDTLEYEGIRDGIECVVRTHKYPLHDEQNNICGTFGASEDISRDLQIVQQEKQKEEDLTLQITKLNKKIHEDSLSKLMNTRYAKKRYTYLYQEFVRENRPFSIILLDSDNFKLINDDFGHIIGDKVIRYIGKILRDIKKKWPKEIDICRIGGDEFLVIVPDATIKEARTLAFIIKEAFQYSSFNEDDISTEITFSMGVGEIQMNENLEDFLHRVDTHLYRAKRNGKNSIDFNVSNLT